MVLTNSSNINAMPLHSKPINNTILLGKYNFINCLPFNIPLENIPQNIIVSTYGTPNTINQLLNKGALNIGPMSSYEYIKDSSSYILLNDISISSQSTVGSVILFSNIKFEDLGGKNIAIAHTSSTSVKLLQLLIRTNCKTDATYTLHQYEKELTDLLKTYDAVLFIGDPALINSYNLSLNTSILQYDLAALWNKITGLPMVFGVWVAPKNWAQANKKSLEYVNQNLIQAKTSGLNQFFNLVLQKAKAETLLPEEVLIRYFKQQLNYDLTEIHKKSITHFTCQLEKNDLL